MVIERDDLNNLHPYERGIAGRFMEKNLRKSGEEEKIVTIGSLDLMPAFKVQDLTGRIWEVRIKGNGGNYLVRSLNPKHEEPGQQKFEYHLWNPGKLVLVPKEKI